MFGTAVVCRDKQTLSPLKKEVVQFFPPRLLKGVVFAKLGLNVCGLNML